MKTEYVVLLVTAGFGLFAWGIRAAVAFTKEMAEWRVQIFGDNWLVRTVADHGTRITTIEKRLGWEGEFGRRASDNV